MADDVKWEQLDSFRMSDEDAYDLIAKAPGCAACWTRHDGHPLGVWVTHVVLDGAIYVTSTENRPKTRAWLADGRTSLVFGLPGVGSVTVVGRVALENNPPLQTRFLEAMADNMKLIGGLRAGWLKAMDTHGRLVGRVNVERLITFDERKLRY